ncbi:MAG: TonB-dependent receptor [Candidatus Polarisedimenticolia bacterium]
MVSLRKSFWSAAALVAALAIAPATAQSTGITLSGNVRNAGNAPIAGATVTATNRATRASESATTGADGAYSFSLPPGKYGVAVSASGFWESTLSVEIVAGRQSQADFSLTARTEEVVTVTATKRETAPIDVPFSLATLSEQDMRDRGAEDIEDVAANVGSFTVQNLGPGQSQVAMRGVSAGQIARDQPGVKEQVGIYLDESPVSLSLFTPDLDLVDVSRVEVLRGPQGTLFGAGSVTGTVRYVTNQPLLNTDEGFVEFGGAGVDGGDLIGGFKAGLNFPMGEKAAARIVGYTSLLPGYTDAVQPDLSQDDDVNGGSRSGARAAVTLAPNGKLTITPRVVYQNVEQEGWNLTEIYNILANPFTTSRPNVDFDELQEFTQLDESFEDDFVLGDVNVRYDFGPVTLTSITSYMDRKIRIVRDTTQLTASFTGGSAGFPEPIYTLDSPLFDHTDATMWTQELRLSSNQTRVQWIAGVFYSDGERDYGQDVKILGFQDATGIPTDLGQLAPKDSIFFSEFDYDQTQIAVFGEATVPATDKFSVTAGLRYYDYDEEKGQLVDGLFGNPNYPASVLSLPGDTDASGVAPRLILTYKATDNAILNAQVSKGFRLGGINDPLNVPVCSPEDLETFSGFDTWDDEVVWNYEVGLKSHMAAGNATFNISAFYMDITDLQTTVTAGTCTSRLIFNVPEARSQGVEVEYSASPTRNFDFAISASYTDAELQSTVTSTDPNGVVSIVSGIEEGRRLPTVPQVQAAASAIWFHEVGAGSLMYVSGTYSHIGSRFTQVGDEDLGTLNMLDPALPFTIGGPLTQTTFRYNPELPAYDLVNLRLGLRRANWDIGAYVNNVTDELAFLALERERGTLARIGYLTNQPRTFGISARYSF